jgi:hypothetical protein
MVAPSCDVNNGAINIAVFNESVVELLSGIE